MQVHRKAVALVSGGLDSMLAARIVQSQGVHIEGLNYFTGFCVAGHTHANRTSTDPPKRNIALWVAEQLGIKLHIIDVIEEYKEVVINPKHGYGAHLNPCLDCNSSMVGKAREWMEQHDFDFIVTGEVLGQRPMSQRRETFRAAGQASTKGLVSVTQHRLDARYLLCPLPVIRTQQMVDQLAHGDIVEVVCTDPGAVNDIPAWCRVHGHELLSAKSRGEDIVVMIKVVAATL